MALSRRASHSIIFASIGILAILPMTGPSDTPRTNQPAESLSAEHDFDFEFGNWVMHRRRLKAGSSDWTESDGDLHTVRKVWGGLAALGELKLQKPFPHFAGSLIHLYNPARQEWSLYWADASDGSIGTSPMTGRFANGRGEFFGRDSVAGRVTQLRIVYSDITPTSFRTEKRSPATTAKPGW